MGATKRAKAEAAAGQTDVLETPPPAALNLRIVFLDNVPLLDSPAWSSEDELDNPTYNKRFRHRKHEEIRQRLQQFKLEARERQQQQQQQQQEHQQQRVGQPRSRSATPQRHIREMSAGREGDAASAQASCRSHSGNSVHADNAAADGLERTRSGRSRRSQRSHGATCAHRPRSGGAGEGGSAAGAAAAVVDAAVPPAAMAAPRAVRSTKRTKLAEPAGEVKLRAATSTAPPVASAAQAPAGEDKRATTADAVRAVASVPAAPPGAAIEGNTSPHPVEKTAGGGRAASPQQPKAAPVQHPSPPAASAATAASRGAKSDETGRPSITSIQNSVAPPKPTPPVVVAFSSTEIRPPTTARGAQTPFSRFFLQKVAKSNPTILAPPQRSIEKLTPFTPVSVSPLQPAGRATTTHAQASPTRPPLPANAAPETTAASSTAHRPPQPPSPAALVGVALPPSAFRAVAAFPESAAFDGAASMPTALDTTRQFTEADEIGEERSTRKETAQSLRAAAREWPHSTFVAPRSPTHAFEAAWAGAHSAMPPLTPPASPTEHLLLRESMELGAPFSVPTSVQPPPTVERCSCSSSAASSGLSLVDRQHQQRLQRQPLVESDYYYVASGIPSCFDLMSSERHHTVSPSLSAAAARTTGVNPAAKVEEEVDHDSNKEEDDVPSTSGDDCSDSYSSGGRYDYEAYYDNEAAVKGSGSWGDVLSPSSAGSDVDYILAHDSSYYSDLLRHLEPPPARKSVSTGGDTEIPSGAERGGSARETAAVVVVEGCEEEGQRQTTASGAAATKPALRSSTRSTHSSLSSSLEHAGRFFYSGAVPESPVPPAYFFYTHLQQSHEGSELTQSEVDFGTGLLPLNRTEYLTALKAAKRSSDGRRGASSTSEDTECWDYYQAKRESWRSLQRAGQSRKKSSSSTISARYSNVALRKGIMASQQARPASRHAVQAAAVVAAEGNGPPQPRTTAVRVISLQGPEEPAAQRSPQPPSLPQPPPPPPPPPPSPTALVGPSPTAEAAVGPLSLENSGSEMTHGSKAFDLRSPVVRKTAAQPEALAVQDGGEEAGMHTGSSDQPHQQKRQEKQPTLFSFAGFAVQPRAALRAKRRAADTIAALVGDGDPPVITETLRGSAVGRPASELPVVLLPEPVDAAAAVTGTPPSPGLLHNHLAADAPPPPPPPHEGYPSAPEPRRFRSLIGSAYLTDVYTSSLRQLASRRRLQGRPLPPEAAQRNNNHIGSERVVSGSGAPLPPPPPSSLAARQPAVPQLDQRKLALAVTDSVPSSWVTTTTMTTTGRSPKPRYRRRHRATRISALLDEAVLWGSNSCGFDGSGPSSQLVRVAAQGCGGPAMEAVSRTSHNATAASLRRGETDSPVQLPGVELSTALRLYDKGSRASGSDGTGGSRVWGPQLVPTRGSATRSVGSFLRMATAPPPPLQPGPSVSPAPLTSSPVGRLGVNAKHQPPQPLNSAIEASPVSVSAMVRRLEANMSAISPVATTMASAKGQQRPPLSTRHTVADRRSPALAGPSSATKENTVVHAQPSLTVSSTQRSVSIHHSDNSDLAVAESVMNEQASHQGAPRRHVSVPQQRTTIASSLSNSKNTRVGVAIGPPPSPVNGSRATASPNSVNDSHLNEGPIETTATKTSAPVATLVPQLTREALMRQQAQQEMILRDQREAQHSPPHLHPLPSSSPHPQQQQKSPHPQLRRRDAFTPTSCNTTEDLLTRITVLGDRRGWSGRPDASVVSALHTSPTAAGSPTASAAAKHRHPASDGAPGHGGGGHHREERGCRFQPLQMTHVCDDEVMLPRAAAAVAPTSAGKRR